MSIIKNEPYFSHQSLAHFNYIRKVDGYDFVLFHKFFEAVDRNVPISEIEKIVHSHQMISCLKQLILYPVHFSPLHFAIIRLRTDIVKVLLHAGALANARELDTNVRPLHLAVVYALPDVIDMLLGFGADPEQRGTLVHNKVFYRGTPAEMAAKGPRTYKQLAVVEALEGQRTFPMRFRKAYTRSIDLAIEEMKSEITKAERVHKEMEKLKKEREELDANLGDHHNVRLEISWGLQQLENSRDNRSKDRVKFLKERMEILEAKLHEERKTLEKNPAMMCPVCLELPQGTVFTCQTCDNLVCDSCKIHVDPMQKCPMCRANLNHLPLLRNRPLERFISAVRPF